MSTCPTCKTGAHTFTEMSPPLMADGKPQPHAAPVMTRKCSNCRQPWPAETASTAPAAPMPAAASPMPPPPAAPPKATGDAIARAARLAPPVQAVEATARLPLVPVSPDYEALMLDELAGLDAAAQHIARRRTYLHNLLSMLGRATTPVADDAPALN